MCSEFIIYDIVNYYNIIMKKNEKKLKKIRYFIMNHLYNDFS
jgi:hypothetical protein